MPIVLYTADLPWGSNESLRDLIEGPPELRDLAPDWRPFFWNLSEHPAEELLSGGPMMQLLAAMRARREETSAYEAVCRRAATNLSSLSDTDMVRWQELNHGLLSIGFRYRPSTEHQALVEIVRETNRRQEGEVSRMAETIANYLMEKGQVRGQLLAYREIVRALLEAKHGPLPESILQRIDACDDCQRLLNAAVKAPQLARVEDLEL